MSDQMLDIDNNIPKRTCFALGKKHFLFDLAAFNRHSNYFSKSPKYRNQDNYIIDLLQEFREDDFLLDDELISKFIDHCNDRRNINININIEKINSLYALAKNFNVTDMIILIETYISENKENFVNSSIKYKYYLRYTHFMNI